MHSITVFYHGNYYENGNGCSKIDSGMKPLENINWIEVIIDWLIGMQNSCYAKLQNAKALQFESFNSKSQATAACPKYLWASVLGYSKPSGCKTVDR